MCAYTNIYIYIYIHTGLVTFGLTPDKFMGFPMLDGLVPDETRMILITTAITILLLIFVIIIFNNDNNNIIIIMNIFVVMGFPTLDGLAPDETRFCVFG